MLNIAGPEYDLAHVVFVVLEECEHRRRSFDDEELEDELTAIARAKLAKIKEAYDEFGGSPVYWASLEDEVLKTALPQYVLAAREMNALERNSFGVWRSGEPFARGVFALGGLVVGGVLKTLPFVPTVENLFALALAGAGFLYPDLKRYVHERRHVRLMNRVVADAAAYQQNARLHYMTRKDIQESFTTTTSSSLTERER